MAAETDVGARAFREAQEITWTEGGQCPSCDCCDQLLCVAAWQATGTTCAAYVGAGHASHLPGARYGPRCPCTSGVTGQF